MGYNVTENIDSAYGVMCMKKRTAVLAVFFWFIVAAGMSQTPFAVETGDNSAQKIVAVEDGDNKSADGTKELKGFFRIVVGVLDILKAIFEGLVPSANAATIDEIEPAAASPRPGLRPAKQPQATNTSARPSTVAAKPSTSSAAGSVAATKAPGAVSPETATGKAVTIGSAKFKEWFKAATDAHCSDWEFPDVTNKYGEKISREDYMRAIIWIESRGIHQNTRGTLTKSWAGAMGFMQLMPNTARGLKVDAKDPAQNLKGGAKYLTEIFNSGAVGKKDGAEKLIMGACAYNLGPFSKSMKMTWNELKGNKKVPAETRGYGLKLKMCLGLELTADERDLVQRLLVGPGQTVDSLIEENAVLL